MKKLVIFVALVAILVLMNVRINRLDHDIDNVYDGINEQRVTINQQTAMLKRLHDDVVYMRAEIADIMIELTRKGLIDPAPPETPSERQQQKRHL